MCKLCERPDQPLCGSCAVSVCNHCDDNNCEICQYLLVTHPNVSHDLLVFNPIIRKIDIGPDRDYYKSIMSLLGIF